MFSSNQEQTSSLSNAGTGDRVSEARATQRVSASLDSLVLIPPRFKPLRSILRNTALSYGVVARLAILFCFLFFAWTTWANWGDLRVDSGREMYVPQSITDGKMLYRDLWYPYGPLAPYLHAVLFGILGSHLYILYLSGLALVLAFSFVLFAVGLRFLSRSAAFIVVLCFMLQAFRPHLFNFVLPYSYAATMGSFCALVFLYFLVRETRGESGSNLPAAGLAAGLALLSKIEFGAACYLTLGFWMLCQMLKHRCIRKLIADLISILPGLLICIAVYSWFAWRLSPSFLFGENSHSSQFYLEWVRRQGFRFDFLEVFALVLVVFVSLAVWFIVAFVLGRALRYHWSLFSISTGVIGMILLALFLNWKSTNAFRSVLLHFVLFPPGMYWLVVILLGVTIIKWWRSGCESSYLALALTCYYSLAIGARVMSQLQPAHYAIYYDTTLFLLFIFVVNQVVTMAGPALPHKRQAMVAIAIMLIVGTGLTATIHPWRELREAALHTDRGTIFGSTSEVTTFAEIIDFIKRQKASGKNTLILPEETSLYYFSGTSAPSRYYALTPGVVDTEEKERKIIAELDSRRIDYILLSNRNTGEYGRPFFGLDYNLLVYQWIEANYEVVGEFGHFSRKLPTKFGMLIYRRRSFPEKGILQK